MAVRKGRTVKWVWILLFSGLIIFSLGMMGFSQEDTTAPEITAPFPSGLGKNPTPSVGAVVYDNVYVSPEQSSLVIDNGAPLTGLIYESEKQTLSATPPEPMKDGEHTVLLKARDGSGNTSTLSWNFRIDTTPPEITKGAPAEQAVQQFNTNILPEYNIYVSDVNKVKTARFYLNNTPNSNVGLLNWGTGQLVSIRGLSLKDGQFGARLELEDYAGNITVRNWTIDVRGVPNISGLTPNGVTTNFTPVIKAYISDNYSGVDTTTMLLSIDGGPEINVASYYNKTSRYLSYPITTPLSPDKHTVTLKARCANGHETTRTWSFWYDLAAPRVTRTVLINYPEYTGQKTEFTVNEGVYLEKGKDLWFAFVISEELASFAVSLDGVPAPARFSYDIAGSMYKQTVTIDKRTLVDGPHTIVVNISDASNNKATHTLNFKVAEAPKITGEYPVNLAKIPIQTDYSGKVVNDRRGEAVISNTRPVISMKITDGNSSLSAENIVFKLDGEAKDFVYDLGSGILTHTPSVDLPNETVHTISVKVTDSAGNTTGSEWKFYINSYPAMPWATDKTCVNCHPDNRNIHMPAPQAADQYGTKCNTCHSENTMAKLEQRCIDCHQSQWHIKAYPQGPYHEVSHKDQTGIPFVQLDTIHQADPGQCAACHAKSINREHQRPERTDANGNPITCDTCHLNTSPTVVQAIYNSQTNCSGCHNLGEGGHEEMHITKIDANCTKVCHKNSLTQEHINNPKTQTKVLSCDTCHGSKNPNVVAAITTNRIECASCHTEAHNMLFALTPDHDIPLFTGLGWTTPMPARIWNGEVPAALENGYVLLSSSSAYLSGSDVLNYYKTQMVANGWMQSSPDPNVTGNYEMTFSKGSRQSLINFILLSGKSETVYRIKIIYN